MRILQICEAHIWEYLLILEKSRVVSTSMKIWILYSLVLCGDRIFFTNEETPLGKKYDKVLICQIIGFLIDNIYIKIGNQLFDNPVRQCIGIPICDG